MAMLTSNEKQKLLLWLKIISKQPNTPVNSMSFIFMEQYDIDQDGIGELFICVQDYKGNEPSALEIKVFKYYPPACRQRASRLSAG